MKLWLEQNIHSDATRDARVALLLFLRDEHGIQPQDAKLHGLLEDVVHAAQREVATFVSRELDDLRGSLK